MQPAVQHITNLADRVLGKHEVAEGSTRPAVSSSETMKAITYQGRQSVAVETVPKPQVTHPGDVVIRVTSCTICSGSDSHIYAGEIPATKVHTILGHEGMGVVESVGPEVKNFSVGDRAVIAFNIACGTCSYCKRQEFSACALTNDSNLASSTYGHCPCAIFGYGETLGGVPGSQAQYVRVPFADVNCYKIPDDVPDEKALYMSDVLCTSLHSVVLAEVGDGDTVAIWGLGPIGLCAARWAQLKGAKTIIGIDTVKERLALARDTWGIHVIDASATKDVPAAVKEIVPEGVDAAIDAAGFRFPTSVLHTVQRTLGMETDSPDIITECFTAVRKYGRVSLIGDYVGLANQFPVGHIMMKHLTVRSGQCPCQRYFDEVLEALRSGKIDPTFMITHRIKLNDVPDAYAKLFKKQDGFIKVFITPE